MIVLDNVRKTYRYQAERVEVLKGIDLSIEHGELVAIVGQSDSSKSALMNILGMQARPTSGRYLFDGEDTTCLAASECAALRSRSLGFVFQGFHLLPQKTVLENVVLPLYYRGVPKAMAEAHAQLALERVGLTSGWHHKFGQLSACQQQRTSIARAIVNRPRVVLADEPTGALDPGASEDILSLFSDLNENDQITIVIATRNPDVAASCPRQLVLGDGLFLSDTHHAGSVNVTPSAFGLHYEYFQ